MAQNNTTYNGQATNGGTHFMNADANGTYTSYLELSSSGTNAAIGYIAGLKSTAPVDGVAHHFMVRETATTWPSVLKIMRNGRIGLGFYAQDESVLGLYVKDGASFSVDDLGDGTLGLANADMGDASAPTRGSIYLGFNAIRQRTFDGKLRFEKIGNKNGGAVIWSDLDGSLSFSTIPTVVGTVQDPQWLTPAQVTSTYRRMRISPTGKVRMGQYAPPAGSANADYQLAVDGKIVTKSVFVTTAAANWADYVFAPDYKLLPLPALETYLATNHHLPAIPSVATVAQTGVDLGDMQVRLLQSVEELTLHVIELNKQNQRLQAELDALAAQVKQAAPTSTTTR